MTASATVRRRGWSTLVAAALFCGAALRFVGLDWDDWHFFNPDERNIVFAAQRLFGERGWHPDFFAYNGLSLYGPRLVAEGLSHLCSGLAGNDPALILMVCRALSAIAGTLAVLVLAACGRRIDGMRGAAIAATFAAFDAGLIQAAHFGTTESGLVLVLTLLAWLGLLLVEGAIRLPRFALASAAILGVGLALKTTALAFGAVPAVAGLLVIRRAGVLRTLLWGLGGGVLALALAAALSPYSLIDFASFRDTMRFEGDVVRGHADVFWTLQFYDTPKALFQLAQMTLLSGPGLAGLGLAGVVATLMSVRRYIRARALLPALVFALAYGAIVFSWQAKFVRYLLLLTPVLVLAATWLAASLLSSRRASGIAVTALALAATVAWGAAFATIYLRQDSRLAASDWLAGHTAPGDVIAFEEREVTPPLPSGRTGTIVPVLDPPAEDPLGALAEAAADADWIVVSSRRFSAALPRLPGRAATCAYYLALADGSLGFRPAAMIERPPGIPPLELPTRYGEETLSVFDHPRVRIYRNTARLDAMALRARLQAADVTLCSRLAVGADLLDIATP